MKRSKSSRDWSFRIQDILHAIKKIEKYIKNITLAEFKKNDLVIDAVIRNFKVIGEATNGIPSSIRSEYEHIPWRQMVELRNFLIHEYFGVDVDTVWQTAHIYLPDLKEKLQALILDN